MATTNTALIEAQLQDAMAEQDRLTQERDELTAILAERDAKIEALEAQIKTLEAKTSRPVQRQDGSAVKALPVLERDPETGRAICPTDPEHGAVLPNTRGKCPKCYPKAVWADSPAGQAALKAEAEKTGQLAAPAPTAA